MQASFRGGTVLAIAHRLDTIIEFDYCLVLGAGKLLEFGTPTELIRSGGAFASMVPDTGEVISNELKHIALRTEEGSSK